MKYKLCRKCGEIKKIKDFSARKDASDGLQSWCRICMAGYAHKNQPSRVEYNRNYRQRKEAKEKQVARMNKLREEGNEKEWARRQLRRAIEAGKIVKPKVCSVCEKEFLERGIHAHHPDYNFPLLVVWCCRSCHKGFHPYKSKYLPS